MTPDLLTGRPAGCSHQGFPLAEHRPGRRRGRPSLAAFVYPVGVIYRGYELRPGSGLQEVPK